MCIQVAYVLHAALCYRYVCMHYVCVGVLYVFVVFMFAVCMQPPTSQPRLSLCLAPALWGLQWGLWGLLGRRGWSSWSGNRLWLVISLRFTCTEGHLLPAPGHQGGRPGCWRDNRAAVGQVCTLLPSHAKWGL